ncbi:hypothetical protein J4G02_05780 [Candidatus Poribacteria bacterium]|nr:hypothetical protein [Candidatus Poribacteria bacterium]
MPPTTIRTRNELRYYKQRGKSERLPQPGMPRLPGGDRTCNEGVPIGVPYEQRGMIQNGKLNSPNIRQKLIAN